MDLMCNFLPGDPRLVEQIVKELKSQGIFDQFRKECISDVDTKPAYQNLRQRVEGSVSSFLKEQTWTPDMNKNQVREMLRKHIHDSGLLETGVERIVDQVVNPKINSVFLPKVEDVMYKFLGIERPKENASVPLEIHTVHDLLPKDLEAVSPEISEEKEINEIKMEDISPNSDMNNEKISQEENSIDSQSSVLSGMVSHDSNNSLKQDSLMSLNSSESRMSLLENTVKIESEDTILSHKSSDSNSKTEQSSDEKTHSENLEINNKNENVNPIEEILEKSIEETKPKSRESTDKKKEKYHSSSDRSKSKSDKEKDKTRSDKHKKEEKDSVKDGKNEKEKYKIPKISDKNKESKSKEKDDKHRSDKGKSEKDGKTDRDRKSDKDRKSKHSSERNSDKSKRDKNEKRDKDEKREKRDSSSKSEKSKEDRRSSSSKKKESSSAKDSHKDKESNTKTKEETSEKNKNYHSSSSSKKDSKSKKDEDKSKSTHRKDDKNDREDKKRKRKSKDDHYSSKDKRSGGRSSDRDSDGPSSNKRIHVSPQNITGEYANQPTSQESSGVNSEGSSGYSGNSDKAEDKPEELGGNALIEIQKIKLPKFASNYQEAMKIMKIRKLLKKLDGINQSNPNDPEVQRLLKDIQDLTKDLKKDKIEHKEIEDKTKSDSATDSKIEDSKSAPMNIEEFISSSNISMAKWNALEAKFMEEITDVDFNSYESPYMDEEETSFEKNLVKEDDATISEVKEESYLAVSKIECEDAITTFEPSEITEVQEEVVIENVDDESRGTEDPEKTLINNYEIEIPYEIETDPITVTEEQNIPSHPVEDDFSSDTTEAISVEKSEPPVDIVSKEDLIHSNFKDYKQRAIVLLKKHALAEEMIKLRIEEAQMNSITEKENKSLSVLEIGKENIEINTIQDELDASVDNLETLESSEINCNKSVSIAKESAMELTKQTKEESNNLQNLEGLINKEIDENNLVIEDSFSQDIDIYSLQNSCEVCLDGKGDVCKGFEDSGSLRSLNIIHYIINIFESEISKSKGNIELYKTNQDNEYQTRKRKVIEKKTDTANNNFDDPASKRLEVEKIKINPKNLSPSKRVQPHTNSKMKSKISSETENKTVEQKALDGQVFERKGRKQSIAPESTDNKSKPKSSVKSNEAVDGSREKKNRTNQRYSSEDLYKPRMYLRRSGRDNLKNP